MTEERQQDLLNYMRKEAYKPLTIKELEDVFDVKGSEAFKEFVKMLNELENQGKILRTRSDRYGVPEKMNLIKGKVQGHAKGFAFLIPEEEGQRDVYIAPKDLNGAMNADTVLVRLSHESSGERPEGSVIRIIERGTAQTVGTYSASRQFGFVIPDDQRMANDIFIPKDASNGAADGHKVVVEITKYPEGRMSAEGKVLEILGHKNDPGVDILSIIYKHGLPLEFPKEVLDEAKAAPETILQRSKEDEISVMRRLLPLTAKMRKI